jgi:hypothetical protein
MRVADSLDEAKAAFRAKWDASASAIVRKERTRNGNSPIQTLNTG